MTEVIELQLGEYPNRLAKHALVISSVAPPFAGCSITDHRYGRRYYATPDEADIALMIRRAKVWAQARGIGQVYLRRGERSTLLAADQGNQALRPSGRRFLP